MNDAPIQDRSHRHRNWDAPEIRVLRHIAVANPTEAALRDAETLFAGALDWPALVRHAEWHGVSALLLRNTKRHFSEMLPASAAEELRLLTLANTQSNLALLGHLIRLHAGLDELAIPHLFFKGLVIASRAYNDLSLRKCGDIDILVPDAQFARTREWFLAQGFEPTLSDEKERQTLQSGLWHPDLRLKVDLHFGIPPRELKVPVDALFDRFQSLALAGRDIPVMADDDMLVTYAPNCIKEYWDQSLYNYADLLALIDVVRPDPDRLLQTASELGCHRSLQVAMALLHSLFDFEFARSTSAPIGDLGTLVGELERGFFDGPRADESAGRGELMHFARHRDFASALVDSTLRRKLLDPIAGLRPGPEDREWLPLPAKLESLYYLLRPIRLLNNRIRGR